MNIQKILRSTGNKATPERIEMFEWMNKKHIFTSSDLEKFFPKRGRASIFRTLKLFTSIGIIRRINLGETIEHYEVEHDNHHHEHMKCIICKKVISFESEKICNKIFSEAKKIGFDISEHSVSILGRCKHCIS